MQKMRNGDIGYVIFAHGSPIESANEAVRVVAAAAGLPMYEVAFLDSAPPTLADAVALLAERGAVEIVVIPYFLTLGMHLQRDLPALVKALERQTPGLQIRVTPPLDGHPALSRIIVDRAADCALVNSPE
jgi:sirohydrochlorin ferrochelatase